MELKHLNLITLYTCLSLSLSLLVALIMLETTTYLVTKVVIHELANVFK